MQAMCHVRTLIGLALVSTLAVDALAQSVTISNAICREIAEEAKRRIERETAVEQVCAKSRRRGGLCHVNQEWCEETVEKGFPSTARQVENLGEWDTRIRYPTMNPAQGVHFNCPGKGLRQEHKTHFRDCALGRCGVAVKAEFPRLGSGSAGIGIWDLHSTGTRTEEHRSLPTSTPCSSPKRSPDSSTRSSTCEFAARGSAPRKPSSSAHRTSIPPSTRPSSRTWRPAGSSPRKSRSSSPARSAPESPTSHKRSAQPSRRSRRKQRAVYHPEPVSGKPQCRARHQPLRATLPRLTFARVPLLVIDDFGLKPLRAPQDEDGTGDSPKNEDGFRRIEPEIAARRRGG